METKKELAELHDKITHILLCEDLNGENLSLVAKKIMMLFYSTQIDKNWAYHSTIESTLHNF